MTVRDVTFAGLKAPGPLVMGIINATPDSFSDGGDVSTAEAVIRRGRQLAAEGADILDIGGESTRPGAAPVSLEEELERVLEPVRVLAGEGYTVSIDTRHSVIMRAAIEAGAAIVNDVSALTGAGAIDAIADSRVSVVLMHMQGEPGTMQADPVYGDVVAEVKDFLKDRISVCISAGIERDRIAIDPGIGFGKNLDHNLSLIRHLDDFAELGCPVLLGTSRKSFIGKITGEMDARKRLAGSLASVLAGVERGADILRVHDVAETRQALSVWRALGL